MAKKIMTCKSAPEIELQFSGGEAILLRFDINCLASIQELEGGLKGFLEKSVSEMAAEVVYAAGKEHNDGFNMLKAKEIIANMAPDNVMEIINTFSESVGTNADGEVTKKLIAQLLEKKN